MQVGNRAETEIDRKLAGTAAEYAEEDRAAAAEEARDAANSRVFSVRLSPSVYEAVRDAAERTHLTPSALIRQWVSERAESTGQDDLASTVAALRRDVERLARLAPPA
jgi:predicted transcriptional regulator